MGDMNNNLSITSRAEVAFCGLEDVFMTMYCRRDFERAINRIRMSSLSARKTRELPKLYAMLDDCRISYEQDKDNTYYEKLINEKLSSKEFDGEWLEDSMVLYLYERFDGYSTPAKYMDRIIRRLQKEEDQEKWGLDSLRLRILKQFIKYGNYLNDVGYGGRLTIKKWVQEKCGISTAKQRAETNADLITEDIFSEFEPSGNKSDVDPKSKYGLMKLSDDLANGKFRT